MGPTSIQSRHLDAAREEAREEALRDADTFSDWLGAECMTKPVSPWRPQLMCAMFSMLSTADLLSLAMDAGQRAQTRTHALDIIAERYLTTRAEQIERKACARASEIAADEEADYREVTA